jgi:UDP-N-acetylenolpyruvoylglucosamine reductase
MNRHGVTVEKTAPYGTAPSNELAQRVAQTAVAEGAVVSAEHGNFVVNDGTASARDHLALIDVNDHRARAERGISLRTELEVIGE